MRYIRVSRRLLQTRIGTDIIKREYLKKEAVDLEQIRLREGCINCIVERQLNHYDKEISEKKKVMYMQGVFKILSEADLSESAPVITERIYKLQKEMFGREADFSKIKHTYNQMMLNKEDEVQRKIAASADPLKRAIQYAMTGNYIDFGALDGVEDEKLEELLERSEQNPVDAKEYANLKKDLEKASKLVYLTDNCGEIVLDKILIGQLMRQYPQIDITVIVRGKPALNDATLEDAEEAGLSKVVTVIGNGNGITGTWLPEISAEAREKIEEADLILSKGQGNFETLQGCGKNIYYMFLCKCKLFVERFQMEQFEGVLANELRCQDRSDQEKIG